ncbi:MAG: hotdog domain-containing protein [Marinilabilia sp.]
MAQEDIYKLAETRQCRMVFPGTLNANGTLFGGEMMKWMDEVAFITATRATRQRIFTARVDQIEFIAPIEENSIIEIIGSVRGASPVKLEVEVLLYAESQHMNTRHKAARAVFVMTALNENNKVTRLSFPALSETF